MEIETEIYHLTWEHLQGWHEKQNYCRAAKQNRHSMSWFPTMKNDWSVFKIYHTIPDNHRWTIQALFHQYQYNTAAKISNTNTIPIPIPIPEIIIELVLVLMSFEKSTNTITIPAFGMVFQYNTISIVHLCFTPHISQTMWQCLESSKAELAGLFSPFFSFKSYICVLLDVIQLGFRIILQLVFWENIVGWIINLLADCYSSFYRLAY